MSRPNRPAGANAAPVAKVPAGNETARVDARPAGTDTGELNSDGSIAAIPSASILKGRDAVNIEHNGRIYQLRKTRQGKLILTK